MVGRLALFLDAIHDQLQAGAETLEQQLLFVLDVVIDRRLGDVQLAGDVVQRGVVVTALPEGPGGGHDHRVALALPIPHSRAHRGP